MFVTIEGPEGAGKSTVMEALADRLRADGKDVVTTREPGSGDLGKSVRHLLLHSEELEPLTELFLFLADRAEHVAKTVRPALEHGQLVLCDRYADSTIVYQGYARGLDIAQLRLLNAMATRSLNPALTLLLDLDVTIGLQRAHKSDRLDREPFEFHQRVREGFLEEAKREPDRWRVVDASQPVENVLNNCWRAVSERL